jgi:hypothetical protein
LTAEASFDCSKQLSSVDFVVLKHRWRWKRVDEEEEMRMAVKIEAVLLHSRSFKHSANNSSRARTRAWQLRKKKNLEAGSRLEAPRRFGPRSASDCSEDLKPICALLQDERRLKSLLATTIT